ncbi:MAG: TSUP family transporter [Clostridia bacterium]|nr:TSUP family transporter [Clostridia bacterium]
MITSTSIYIFFIILLAGILQTMTGFGFALVATPLLAFMIDPIEAIAIVLFVGTLTRIFMLYETWNDGKFSHISLIFIASIIGGLPGAYGSTGTVLLLPLTSELPY